MTARAGTSNAELCYTTATELARRIRDLEIARQLAALTTAFVAPPGF